MIMFWISDRPKLWKLKCLSVLKTNVQERIEGNQLDVREENKMWLVRHLVMSVWLLRSAVDLIEISVEQS